MNTLELVRSRFINQYLIHTRHEKDHTFTIYIIHVQSLQIPLDHFLKSIFCKYKQMKYLFSFSRVRLGSSDLTVVMVRQLDIDKKYFPISLSSLALAFTVVRQVSELVPQQTNFLSFPGLDLQSFCTWLL